MVVRRSAAVFGVLILAGCSPSEPSQKSAATPPVAAPAPPTHFYETREGDKYYYQAVISEDDRRAGKGTPELVPVRYRGVVNGEYTLELDSGAHASCPADCKYVHEWVGSGRKNAKLVPYVPATILGSALQDAFNGQLDEAR